MHGHAVYAPLLFENLSTYKMTFKFRITINNNWNDNDGVFAFNGFVELFDVEIAFVSTCKNCTIIYEA